jgi:hypothetical protein
VTKPGKKNPVGDHSTSEAQIVRRF